MHMEKKWVGTKKAGRVGSPEPDIFLISHNLVFRRFSTMATITSTSSMAPPTDPPTTAYTDTCFSANQDIMH